MQELVKLDDANDFVIVYFHWSVCIFFYQEERCLSNVLNHFWGTVCIRQRLSVIEHSHCDCFLLSGNRVITPRITQWKQRNLMTHMVLYRWLLISRSARWALNSPQVLQYLSLYKIWFILKKTTSFRWSVKWASIAGHVQSWYYKLYIFASANFWKCSSHFQFLHRHVSFIDVQYGNWKY